MHPRRRHDSRRIHAARPLVALALAAGLVLPSSASAEFSRRTYLLGSVVSGLGTVALAVGGYMKYSDADSLLDEAAAERSEIHSNVHHWKNKSDDLYYTDRGRELVDRSDRELNTAAWLAAGAVAMAVVTWYSFDRFREGGRASLLRYDGERLALGAPEIGFDPERGEYRAGLLEVAF